MTLLSEHEYFFERLKFHKKIAAIKSPRHIETAIKNKNSLSGVYLLTGSITVIKSYVNVFKKENLPVFVHIEKIGGLSVDHEGMNYLAKSVMPTGIVTTKPNNIIHARKCGLLTIQRVFAIDSEVIENLVAKVDINKPHLVEIMPARVVEIITLLKNEMNVPIISGGLIKEREHAVNSLKAGAVAISTSNVEVWKEDISGVVGSFQR
ncbi:glycerol-3-phosphate responsive antiterminator [Alkalihalobacillus sp. BA299]|uniref:glycerol-3-phosphate responsive antiterminator n=1 Tax=Alkalihalobacillus sp. BA299 TaxID=2815938 RepID=UPI001ADBA269|nr:glycerol-3-phosphate responsive antiterminator [Alkalihalobacillus sp. BA299]